MADFTVYEMIRILATQPPDKLVKLDIGKGKEKKIVSFDIAEAEKAEKDEEDAVYIFVDE